MVRCFRQPRPQIATVAILVTVATILSSYYKVEIRSRDADTVIDSVTSKARTKHKVLQNSVVRNGTSVRGPAYNRAEKAVAGITIAPAPGTGNQRQLSDIEPSDSDINLLWTGVAFMGNDIAHQTTLSIHECISLCKARSTCNALSFNIGMVPKDAKQNFSGVCWLKSSRPMDSHKILAWASTTSWDGTKPISYPAPAKATSGNELAILLPSFSRPREGIQEALLRARLNEVCSVFMGHEITIYLYTNLPDSFNEVTFKCGIMKVIKAAKAKNEYLNGVISKEKHNENIGNHFIDAADHIMWHTQTKPGYVFWLEDDVELSSTGYLPTPQTIGFQNTSLWSFADTEGFEYPGVGAWGLLFAPGDWTKMLTCMRSPRRTVAPDWKASGCCKDLGLRCVGFGPHAVHIGVGVSSIHVQQQQ